MITIQNVSLSRRRFLNGAFSAGAFVIASRVLPDTLFTQEAIFRTKADGAALHPSVYLGIEPDGTVFIVTHRSEMGTGIRTSLPLVAADELDARHSYLRTIPKLKPRARCLRMIRPTIISGMVMPTASAAWRP